jgi:hypothetical protein
LATTRVSASADSSTIATGVSATFGGISHLGFTSHCSSPTSGACFATEDIGTVADPAATRVGLRVGTKQAIQDAVPKTAEGDFIDPNTGQVIPKEGPFDYGHQPGFEWWRTQQMAREQGWTREQVIEYENDPSHYQIEDPSANRSHLYEMP